MIHLRNTFLTSCLNGHDLTGPDAFIYRTNGDRACRVCVLATETRKNPKNRPDSSLMIGTWRG